MKKVLIISHAAGTPDIGPNMRVYYLAKNLVALGHKVNIVGSGVFHKYYKSPLEQGKYTYRDIDGIGYHWLPTISYGKSKIRQVLNQLDFVYLLRKNRKKFRMFEPDVVIFSSPPPFGILEGYLLARKCKAKLIFEIRDLWPEILHDLGGFGKMNPYTFLVRKVVKFGYAHADGVVSVKKGDLAFIRDRYEVPSKMAYIPNGFDHINLSREPYSDPSLTRPGFKVVYTGALSAYYSMEHLLLAAEKLNQTHKEISVIIVGDGESRQQLEKMKLEKALDNVHFLGQRPKKYMLSIISQCDIAFLGLRDTRANKFGISTNKLFEYMFAKVPIVASYSTDYDIINEANCGISVPPESSEEIYRAIVKLFSQSSVDLSALGENGYNYLMQHHTFEQITHSYIKFIDSIGDEK